MRVQKTLRAACRVVALCVHLLFLGCDRWHNSVSVVAVPLTAAGAPMLTERTGLEEATVREGLLLDWNGPGERDTPWQVDRIQTAIQERPYGIVVTPFSTFGVNTSVREALARKIPVVIVGSPLPLPPEKHLSFVLEDIAEGGFLLQAHLDKVLGHRGRIAVFGMDPLSTGSDARAAAFERALRLRSPGIEVIARVPGPINAGYLDLAAEQLIRAHPELDAIVAMSASAGMSAARAIRGAKLSHPIHLLSSDFTLDTMLLVRHGEAEAVLVQDLRGMGVRAVQNLVADHAGKAVPAVVSFRPTLVTRNNIDEEGTQQLMLLQWHLP